MQLSRVFLSQIVIFRRRLPYLGLNFPSERYAKGADQSGLYCVKRMYSHSVMAGDLVTPEEILQFWFADSKRWYMKDDNFDKEIKTKFESTMKKAANGELSSWMDTPDGALALVILLDQFTRNVYRNSPESFAYDAKALDYSKEAIRRGHDKVFKSNGETKKQGFLYMPFMHSESKADHEEALKLFDQPGLEANLAFEKKHKEIIDRFGRYAHRNEILGRQSTPEEIEFVKVHGGF